MSETLHIKNFGPIKDIKLDLRKFNVIIGENATGKSTIAKVLAMCRYFSFVVKTHFTPKDVNNSDENNFSQGLESWGLQDFYKNGGEISYSNINYSFKIEFKVQESLPKYDVNGNVTIERYISSKFHLNPISKKFKSLLEELNTIKPKDSSQLQNWHVPTSFFQNDVSRVMDNPFYLPTERGLQSIFSLGKNSIQNISDSLFNQLANLDLIARNFVGETVIEPLNITYKNVDGKGYIKKNSEDEFYSLYNGASGYKSTIPIILVIKYYNEIRKKNKTFLIEEPEVNLFPKVQQELIKYLVAETVNKNSQAILTTHSPYILTSINNLMYAYKIGIANDKVENVVSKKYWLNPKDVSCYLLKTEGTCESIIDEDGLIKAEKIDEVSDKINTEYAQIGEIRYGG